MACKHDAARFGRGAALGFGVLALLATAAFRCPGPDPQSGPGGGAGGDGASGGSSGGSGGDNSCPGTLCGALCVDLATDIEHCGACDRFCSAHQVDVPSCNGGMCDSTCLSGAVNTTMPLAPAPDDGCELQAGTARRVFITSLPILASFDGLVGADSYCQGMADQVALGGTWLAWLSDSTSTPLDRFIHYAAPYVLLSGTPIAADWPDLLDGQLAHGIDEDEFGYPASGFEVWTGTTYDGFGDGWGYCTDWTSLDGAETATVGLSGSTTTWSDVFLQFCDRDNVHLYCFEQ